MSTDGKPQAEVAESFQQKLQRLRLKIDSLPQVQRPHLIDLAETIERQHRQLHAKTEAVPLSHTIPPFHLSAIPSFHPSRVPSSHDAD
jgi:hypothetical protein